MTPVHQPWTKFQKKCSEAHPSKLKKVHLKDIRAAIATSSPRYCWDIGALQEQRTIYIKTKLEFIFTLQRERVCMGKE